VAVGVGARRIFRVYIAAVVLPALLLFAQAGLVAVVPDSGPGCPSAKDVEEALYARVPSAVIPFSEARRRGSLQLMLTPAAADGRRSFTLLDSAGHTRLQRPLPVGSGQQDCVALAETTALIVQRFLSDIDDPVPEPAAAVAPVAVAAPAPAAAERDRRWDLSLSSGWRVGSDVWGGLTVAARAARLLGRSGRLLLAGAAGVGGAAALEPNGRGDFRGTARARPFPIELGLWWRTVGWRAELQLGGGGGLDVTHVLTRASSGNQETHLLPGPIFFGAAALRVPLRGRTFFRLSGGAAGSAVTYRFSHQPESSADNLTVFTVPTRRFYVRIGADIGFQLR
jgi:hypothetical protein